MMMNVQYRVAIKWVFCDFAKYEIGRNKILISQNNFVEILRNTFTISQNFVVFLVSQKKFRKISSNTYFADYDFAEISRNFAKHFVFREILSCY